MKILRLLVSAFIISALFLALMPCGIALADQSNPDDVPSMTADVYRNLLETGDQLYIFYANIPYSATPDALVTEAFIWRLFDSDNSTVVGQSTGTAFQASGYGYNVYSMYFAAVDAPTWDQPYIVRLSGNPTIFDTPPEYNFVLDSSDYNTAASTTVKSDLCLRIIVIARDLFNRWSLDADTTLITEQETGTVLSARGETFFRGAIFGLQALAPCVFQIGIGSITAVDREWDTEYSANISSQYTGTWVETAQTAGADMFNKGYDLTSIILLLVIVVAVVAGNLMITRNVWSGLIDVTLVAVLFGRIGIPGALLPFLGLVGASSWVYISGKVWGVWR